MHTQHLKRLATALGLLLLLSACGQQSAPSTQPPTPTATSVRPTLPPSWTPGSPPPPGQDAPTETPFPANERSPIPGRPTLPPSWTPRPFVTVTRPVFAPPDRPTQPPTLTPAFRATSPFNELMQAGGPPTPDRLATYPAACNTLTRSEPTDRQIFTGDAARIAWTAVEGATEYRIWLLNPGSRYVVSETITETTFTFPAETFPGPGLYGWEVIPFRDGARLCQSISDVINVRLRIGG